MLESQKEQNTHCSMWFIGLEFAKTENLSVDLTRDIQLFTEQVDNYAVNIQMWREGMRLDARHVKRKQLSQYLAPSLIKRDRKSSITKNGNNESKKRVSTEPPIEPDSPVKKTRLSEECVSQVILNIHIMYFIKIYKKGSRLHSHKKDSKVN